MVCCCLQDFANIPGLQVTAPINAMGGGGGGNQRDGNQQGGFGRQQR